MRPILLLSPECANAGVRAGKGGGEEEISNDPLERALERTGVQ